MPGILPDVNLESHFRILLRLLSQDWRQEIWTSLNWSTTTFRALGLPANAPDVDVWKRCQAEKLVLLTGNRNQKDSDSLEATIRALNTPESLPVFTLGRPDRFLVDRQYAVKVADQMLEYAFDIGNHLGTGRIFLP